MTNFLDVIHRLGSVLVARNVLVCVSYLYFYVGAIGRGKHAGNCELPNITQLHKLLGSFWL
jgi:hypothetical protein